MYKEHVGESTLTVPVIDVKDIQISVGTVYSLTDKAADSIFGLEQATIVIRYRSTSTQPYQSLFSVSNSTAGNEDRHFHIYVTPSGDLGMELRNTDSEFKYTMSATNAVVPGRENIIAFSADSSTKQYKLFANGALVSTLTEENYRFFANISGLNTVSLGGTVRNGVVKYPFGGTIYCAEVYSSVLDDETLIKVTSLRPGDDNVPSVSLELEDICITAGTVYALGDEQGAENIPVMTEGTVLVQYTSESTNAFQSLFSVSNGTGGNEDRHFHIYITPDGQLGFELRNTNQEFKYADSRPSSVRNSYLLKPAKNTIAFKADRKTRTYTLFANGEKLTVLSVQDFKFFSNITGVNTVSLGGTIRNGKVAYPFGGEIELFYITSEVLSDEELMKKTDVTTYGELIFSDRDATNSNYFRIPSLLKLKSGTIAAAADARYGGTHDSKSNIDIAFSSSADGGVSWSKPILPLCFNDYAAQRVDWPRQTGLRDLQIQGSASFIDTVMVQNQESGRLFLFADVMPAGIGSSNASIGNGYKTVDGKEYLELRWYEDAGNVYDYTIREDGVIYNDLTNKPTNYTVNEHFEIFCDGKPLTVRQYTVSIQNGKLSETKTDVEIAMSIFYKDAFFKVFPTSYLGMIYSDDDGRTWSPLQLLNTLKSNAEKLLITGPGVGIQIRKGTYAGRLVVPVYSVTLSGFGVVYSDDGGDTWLYAPADSFSTGSTAEAQIAEMPDGSLKAYIRTSKSYVAERTSIDGGVTWTPEKEVADVLTTSYGTQMSVINYSELIDGKPAVLMSSPNSRTGRNTGMIRIGLVTDTGLSGADRYAVEWAYNYEIDGPEGFSYSCMTELPNKEIGIFYERFDSWSREQLHLKNVLPIEKYSISELKAGGLIIHNE